MTRHILPIAALLLGAAFLLFAGGINALILPVRGTLEGFGSLPLGLLGTGWAVGYIAGCLFVPALVARVGHIRSFSVVSALAGLAVLLSLIIVSPWAWIPLRAISGFCFAGAAMIVEGWLAERSDARSRGTIFGFYMTINLAATTAGQMIIVLGDPKGFIFFVLAAMFYMLALIPTAVSAAATPQPLVQPRLDIGGLYRNSPVAVIAAFFVGISNSAFATLSAVYASGIGLDLANVALFASLPLLAGALAQIPIGYVSDRVDRRLVLTVVALLALAADAAFLLLADVREPILALTAAAVLGAAIFSMYPIMLAHANDYAPPERFVMTSSGLLLIFGVGTIIGPLLAGVAMEAFGGRGLFAVTAVAHILIAIYALYRVGQRAPLPTTEKGQFVTTLSRATTPQTAVLAETPEPTPEPEPAEPG